MDIAVILSPFDRPFGTLTVPSNVDGLTALSTIEGKAKNLKAMRPFANAQGDNFLKSFAIIYAEKFKPIFSDFYDIY